MVFEVRNKNFNEMMNTLPALDSKESKQEESLPDIPFPKVVLEDISEQEKAPKKPNVLKKKVVLFVLAGLVLAGAALYSQYESNQKKKQLEAELQKQREEEKKLELFYQDALNSYDQHKYTICMEQLAELHKLTSSGSFKESAQLLISCEEGLARQRQKEEALAREEKKKQTEEQIKHIVEKCKAEYSENKIKTEEDLNICAVELLSGLDPGNADISSMRMEIVEKKNLKFLQDQKKAEYMRFISSKKALYNRAKKKAEQNEVLEAVAAYDVFLKSARGVSSLKSLLDQAQSERDAIQTEYDQKLANLHQSCEALIKSQKMKEAYNNCKQVLLFKADDVKARENMMKAKKTLRKEFKLIYEQSMMDESFSRIEKAKKAWNEILEKDVKEGHYYQKALSQIKKL